MPGVTTDSGSSVPAGTTSSTSTMVQVAAVDELLLIAPLVPPVL